MIDLLYKFFNIKFKIDQNLVLLNLEEIKKTWKKKLPPRFTYGILNFDRCKLTIYKILSTYGIDTFKCKFLTIQTLKLSFTSRS